MKLELLKPAKALNKAYFKQSLKREQIDLFKSELQKTFNHVDEKQDEEYHKNIISDFLKAVYCKDKYIVNVNKRQDLVIRLGNETTDSVGVILEFKKPTEKKDMVSKDKANVKALQELVLYYLRETIDNNNHEIKHLIATNIYEWFVFDEVWFEKNIFANNKLKKAYEDYKVSGHGTQHFYDFIAAKYLDNIEEDVSCTYFNLKDFEKIISNPKKADDNKLIDLYKILSPEHLLKKPFANDSNTLNKEFYNELLYIIGLEEKSGARKLIDRRETNERAEGSLLENTITVLKRQKRFGYDEDEATEIKYFDLALELCITWLNRILFLKLLEGQLIKYHRGDTTHSFLNTKRIKDYGELDELFFEVLAAPHEKRSASVNEKYGNIPYLNSSLFEPSDYELQYQGINQLKDRLEIPIYSSTVLKDTNGKRISGKKLTLQYLFEFLEAYNFASDSSAEIQEENKTIINASVLGLIFEKINGYKDGSFFTPGFITMYMCRETIRKAVLQKFNEANEKWNCKTFEELKDKIDHTEKEERKIANNIINTIKICDPAVGSGHFLVSALNELIAVKSDLQILNYRDGSRVKGFKIEIANDELIITNEEADQLFAYTLNQNNKPIEELQQLQESLFHEKQDLIEKSLFGVDINPKSVLICRLRLWIELLKNSYYTKKSKYGHLETLPNIDINIKCGNSLISRFAINDKNNILPKDRAFVKQLIEKYKILVEGYKNALDKKAKDDFRKQIGYSKTEFQKFTFVNDKDYAELKKKEGELFKKQSEIPFGGEEERKVWTEKLNKIAKEVVEFRKSYEEKLKTLYSNALEWRFEFPEVLDNDGIFNGFDVIIGNPPYLSYYSRESVGLNKYEEAYYRNSYKFLIGESRKLRINTVMFFCEMGFNLLKQDGHLSFIVDFNILENPFIPIRRFIVNNYNIQRINKGLQVFEDVGSGQVMGFFKKDNKFKQYELIDKLDEDKTIIKKGEIDKTFYKWISNTNINLFEKIEISTEKLEEKLELITGVAVYATEEGKNKFIKNSKLNENFYPLLEGGSSIPKSYSIPSFKSWINYDKKLEKELNKEFDEKYFAEKGSHQRPFNLRTIGDFNRPKIFIRQSDTKLTATYSEDLYFGNYSLFTVYLEDNDKKQLKAYLALINSKLLTFYAREKEIILVKQGKTPQIRSGQRGPIGIRQLPLRTLDGKTVNTLSKIVDDIYKLKRRNKAADITDLENKINENVYELYRITATEQKIIEGQ